MDKLSFKRKTSKTNPKEVGFGYEYILAETIINYRPFLDYLEREHRYDYNLAVDLYNQLIGSPKGYDPIDGWPGKNNAALLTCNVCFIARCEPLTFTFEETDTTVIWSGYYNYQTKRNYNEIPVFCFEKEQYKTALEQLKVIADEGARVGMKK